MYVIIVGCGALGTRSAYSQLHAGHEVLLLDTDENRVDMVQKNLGNVALLGDATEEFTLHSAGINRCDALIATTGDDAVNPACAFITIVALIVGVAQMVFLFNVAWSLLKGKEAGRNPWKAGSLEWQTPGKRPGHGNWGESVPLVYRWAYAYSVPGVKDDFIPQHIPPGEVVRTDGVGGSGD
jgi:cytochrome c oxidase subunit 1